MQQISHRSFRMEVIKSLVKSFWVIVSQLIARRFIMGQRVFYPPAGRSVGWSGFRYIEGDLGFYGITTLLRLLDVEYRRPNKNHGTQYPGHDTRLPQFRRYSACNKMFNFPLPAFNAYYSAAVCQSRPLGDRLQLPSLSASLGESANIGFNSISPCSRQ